MKTPVKFPIAKLLKEKGFDKETNDYFLEDGIEYSYPKKENWNLKTDTISQPTISEVVMWLYEKHGIWIIADPSMSFSSWTPRVFTKHNTVVGKYNGIMEFNSPTEAYEAAIEHCLTKLI